MTTDRIICKQCGNTDTQKLTFSDDRRFVFCSICHAVTPLYSDYIIHEMTGSITVKGTESSEHKTAAAFQMLNLNDVEQAKVLFTDALSLNPNDVKAKFGTAMLAGRFDTAQSLCANILPEERELTGLFLIRYFRHFADLHDINRCLLALKNSVFECDITAGREKRYSRFDSQIWGEYKKLFQSVAALNHPTVNQEFAKQYYRSANMQRLEERDAEFIIEHKRTNVLAFQGGELELDLLCSCSPLSYAAAMGADDLLFKLLEQARRTGRCGMICVPNGRRKDRIVDGHWTYATEPIEYNRKKYPIRMIYSEAIMNNDQVMLEKLFKMSRKDICVFGNASMPPQNYDNSEKNGAIHIAERAAIAALESNTPQAIPVVLKMLSVDFEWIATDLIRCLENKYIKTSPNVRIKDFISIASERKCKLNLFGKIVRC